MNYDLISVKETHNGQVAEITLQPAPANILSAKMMGEISACLKELEADSAKKLIVFAGEGKHFCFGASVEEHVAQAVGNMLPKFHLFIEDVLTCSIPTLAKVSGRCLGGGFELALACTFLFANNNAKFAVPEIQLGVFPPVACALLPLRTGDALASQIILSGDIFSAEKLYSHNVINQVADEGELDATINLFIEKSILAKSASSLRIATKASRLTTVEMYKKHIGQLEELYLKDLMSTKDANTGIESFINKKTPVWENK